MFVVFKAFIFFVSFCDEDRDMNGSRIDTISAEKDLGVFITVDLTWATHVSSQCAKANKLTKQTTNTRTQIRL